MFSIGYKKDLAETYEKMLIGIIPAIIVSSITETMKIYAIAMRVYQPFTYLNIAAYLITIFCGWYFI